MNITFHARRTDEGTGVALELWKDLDCLGVWLLSQMTAERLKDELAEALQMPLPESFNPDFQPLTAPFDNPTA